MSRNLEAFFFFQVGGFLSYNTQNKVYFWYFFLIFFWYNWVDSAKRLPPLSHPTYIMSQQQIVQLDPQTKALQLRSGPNHSEIHLGSIADAHLFLHYTGRRTLGTPTGIPTCTGRMVCSWASAPLAFHCTRPSNCWVLLCEGKLNLDEREAFFDEFVADDLQVALRVWICWGEVYHMKRLKFYALPDALLLLPGVCVALPSLCNLATI